MEAVPEKAWFPGRDAKVKSDVYQQSMVLDTACPRLDGHAAESLPELVELTGIEPVTS
jgi:hypothetical protein